MKFNIGDLVYIRYHADDEKDIYSERFGVAWLSDMDEFEGHVGVITHHDLCSKGEQYLVDYDGEEYWFSVGSLDVYEPTFAIGTRVLIRHHSNDEKQQYHSQYSVFWKQPMNAYEGQICVIEKCDVDDGNPIYAVLNGTGYWWFVESSLIPVEYDVF